MASHHTDFVGYARARSADPAIEAGIGVGISLLYSACERVLSPTAAADRSLAGLGVGSEKLLRWGRGVDARRFDPGLRDPEAYPGEIKVLYAGRQSTEKGVELLADAFLDARRRDPRLHLLLAGGGPEEAALRERLGGAATFLGWQYGTDLARTYASADVFLFASQTDTYGQVLVEAQASGLAVVAVDAAGPSELIEDGRTGMLRPPEVGPLADALVELAGSPGLRARLAGAALASARRRSWEGSMAELAAAYEATFDAVAAGASSGRAAPAGVEAVAVGAT